MSQKRKLTITMTREVDVEFLVNHLMCTDERCLLGGLDRASFHLAVGAVDHTLGKMLEEHTRIALEGDRRFAEAADDSEKSDSQWAAEFREFVCKKRELEERIRGYCREQGYL